MRGSWCRRWRRPRDGDDWNWKWCGCGAAEQAGGCSWRLMMRRVLCVHLPHWPLQRLWHAQPALRRNAMAIVGQRGRFQTVIWFCKRARYAGVRLGMPRAEALAVLPSLTVVEEDLDADYRALTKLATWADRFSPIVGLEQTAAPASLLIDVTGCANCFGGEQQLLARAHEEFRKQGWQVRCALADTVGAAWALAHFADELPCEGRGGVLSHAGSRPLPNPPLKREGIDEPPLG